MNYLEFLITVYVALNVWYIYFAYKRDRKYLEELALKRMAYGIHEERGE